MSEKDLEKFTENTTHNSPVKRVRKSEPLETEEQQRFIKLVHDYTDYHPGRVSLFVTDLLFAVPNGAAKSISQRMKFKREGLKSGVPDLMLPIARGGYFGWFGELKRVKSGALSEEQSEFIKIVRHEGYWAGWHRGAGEMFDDLIWYLNLPQTAGTHGFGGERPTREQRPTRKLDSSCQHNVI